MNTVYLLWEWTFGDHLLGVYSTFELADAEADRLIANNTYAYDRIRITEHTVREEIGTDDDDDE